MKQVKGLGDELTLLQREALEAFRERNGRYWKSSLRTSWELARYPGMTVDHAAALQQVRNTLGPEWLMKYRAPDASKKMSHLVLEIHDTCTQAFSDVGRSDEIARILNAAADKIEAQSGILNATFPLYDINGNRVGFLDVVEKRPESEVANGAVRMVIETSNLAPDDGGPGEVARILRDAAEGVSWGKESFALRDHNGNMVGRYEYRGIPSLERGGVIDMGQALSEGRVYLAEGGRFGIAEGEYRFAITAPGFEPGYGNDWGEIWLANAKGEIASGYEDREEVRNSSFEQLPRDVAAKLVAVVAGSMSFEEFEREFDAGAGGPAP